MIVRVFPYFFIEALLFSSTSAKIATFCPDGYAPISPHLPTVIEYPVSINTYLSHNATLIINGGIHITINNAPTSLDLITTGTSTAISTTRQIGTSHR